MRHIFFILLFFLVNLKFILVYKLYSFETFIILICIGGFFLSTRSTFDSKPNTRNSIKPHKWPHKFAHLITTISWQLHLTCTKCRNGPLRHVTLFSELFILLPIKIIYVSLFCCIIKYSGNYQALNIQAKLQRHQ